MLRCIALDTSTIPNPVWNASTSDKRFYSPPAIRHIYDVTLNPGSNTTDRVQYHIVSNPRLRSTRHSRPAILEPKPASHCLDGRRKTNTASVGRTMSIARMEGPAAPCLRGQGPGAIHREVSGGRVRGAPLARRSWPRLIIIQRSVIGVSSPRSPPLGAVHSLVVLLFSPWVHIYLVHRRSRLTLRLFRRCPAHPSRL